MADHHAGLRRPGDLWYAHTYDPNRWTLGPAPGGPPPDPSVIPEFFGDTILVNGTVYPYVEVEPAAVPVPRAQRLQRPVPEPAGSSMRRANGDAVRPSRTRPNAPGPAFIQIGTEGGFLPYPRDAQRTGAAPQLLLAPAERADLIVDFRNVPRRLELILYNDAPAPYPTGDRRE